MNTSSDNHRLIANTIGRQALGVLASAHEVKVLASVSEAIYLSDQNGELWWVISKGRAMHQRAAQIAAPVPRVQVGMDCRIEDHSLSIGPGQLLDFSRAAAWNPTVVAISEIVPLSVIEESLLLAVNALGKQTAPTGFGNLLPAIIQLCRQQPLTAEVSLQNGSVRAAWLAVLGIILATQAGDATLWIRHAGSLIGLGEGLTPSGDDFLGGFIFAVQQLYNFYPGCSGIPASTYQEFILQSKSLTNPISYTLLFDHACGQSIEPTHQLVNGLLHGDSMSSITTHLQHLVSVGHSTGWDILSGFTAGMLSITGGVHR